MMAIHGTNFCASARDAFSLLSRNVVRVIVLDKITDFLLCMGKLAITLSFGWKFYADLC
jgi:choline transporter-like protein 2/4/5